MNIEEIMNFKSVLTNMSKADLISLYHDLEKTAGNMIMADENKFLKMAIIKEMIDEGK